MWVILYMVLAPLSHYATDFGSNPPRNTAMHQFGRRFPAMNIEINNAIKEGPRQGSVKLCIDGNFMWLWAQIRRETSYLNDDERWIFSI